MNDIDNLSFLIHYLVTGGRYEELRGAHATLRTAAVYLTDPMAQSEKAVFRNVLDYAERYSRYPTYPELIRYCEDGTYVHDGPREMIADAARAVVTLNLPPYQGSMAQMLDETVVAARNSMYARALGEARSIFHTGTVSDKWGKQIDVPPSGRVDAAIKSIREAQSKDFTLPPCSPEGSWTENSDLIADQMIASLTDTVHDRIRFGLRHVDRFTMFGPQQEAACCAILGASHGGKSLLMRQLAYNMRMAGKYVLYIGMEEKAIHCWIRLAFLHKFHRPELIIPPLSQWKQNPESITDEHKDNLRVLIDDIHFGCGSGDISVFTHRVWADIIREMDTGHNGRPWDAVFIDYPDHLKTGKKGAEHHEEILGVFHEMQELSHGGYKNGRGVGFVYGLQANKAGIARANDAEGPDWGVYDAAGAIEQYTPAYHDADIVLNTWLGGPLRVHSMLKISNLKNRGGDNLFPPHFISIDPTTSALEDLPGGPKCDLALISTYRAALEDSKLEAEDVEAYG